MSLSFPGMSYLPVLESVIPLAFARRAQVWVGRVEEARLETVHSYSVCGDASPHQSPGEEPKALAQSPVVSPEHQSEACCSSF